MEAIIRKCLYFIWPNTCLVPHSDNRKWMDETLYIWVIRDLLQVFFQFIFWYFGDTFKTFGDIVVKFGSISLGILFPWRSYCWLTPNCWNVYLHSFSVIYVYLQATVWSNSLYKLVYTAQLFFVETLFKQPLSC